MISRSGLPPDGDNPWRTESTQVAYSNDWITVEHDRVITPSGQPGVYGVVRPANIALGIVAVDDELHTWLVGQYRYTLNRYSWEIPEGGGDPGKDPELEAARELAEETGLRAGKWQLLLKLHTSNSFTDEAARIYLARDLTPGTARPEPTEQLTVLRLPLTQALDRVFDGTISDAISVAALLTAARELDVVGG